MKILLLTDIPPCKNYTAGLVLDQLCRFLPKNSVACFAVVNPNLDAQISSDLDWIPIEYYNRPRDNWHILPSKLGNFTSFIMESYMATLGIKPIIAKAVKFGRDFGADVLWCVLQGQTMIRLARPVSQGMGVPLLTQVWDPPHWWLRANKLDRFSKKNVLKEFGEVMKLTKCCATASWAMAEIYNERYGVKSIPVMPSLDSALALPPAEEIHNSDKFVIGMAGQIYAGEEWNALVRALDKVNWKIAGRDIVIRILGRYVNLHANGKARIEFWGWASQVETIELMSKCDVLYCPYWFDPLFKEEASLSFPSKLTTYLAAGRPVLFHGPEYASPSIFLQRNNAGLCCHSLETTEIINALTELINNKILYSTVARNGMLAFENNLSLKTMRSNFTEFIQIKESF